MSRSRYTRQTHQCKAKTMTSVTQHDFTMDPNLLVAVIKSQAGTLSKALLEGVMNSIDAGSPRVDITLTETGFTITDTGRGFTSEEEIRTWFGRFGTPHAEGDAVFGRFRMGRGQMFAFAKTTWRSGPFRMHVDIEGKGLRYDLERQETPTRGCVIEAELYQPLSSYKFSDTLTELKKFIAFTPKPVYVNGQLYGEPAARLKNWTYQDDDAYYRVVQDATELQVYNQGVFVEDMSTWRVGMGGIVVSKSRLDVNLARNSVMEDRCPVWKRIAAGLEKTVLAKLTAAKKLEDGDRKFLARRLPLLMTVMGSKALSAKVLTDPSGKHIALGDLRHYKRFVHVQEATPAACAAHGRESIFVVTDSLLTRFGVDTLDEWLRRMDRLCGVLHHDYEVLQAKAISRYGLDAAEVVDASGMTAREQAAFAALTRVNDLLAERLIAAGIIAEQRTLLVGRHKKSDFVAWTDGKSFITANKRNLKRFELGLDGVSNWVHVLIHEYTHDTDDSESHSHGEVFYRKFHDTLFNDAETLALGKLAQQGLVAYLEELSKRGVPRPHALTRELKPLTR